MPARHAILGLLMDRPMHGYDIDGAFEEGIRAICHVNISQIYAYLKSMEDKGWIEGELVIQKSNPPKKVFHVTDAGRAEMSRWLGSPVVERRQMRDSLLTKIYFCWMLAPQRLESLIQEQREALQAAVRSYERQIDEADSEINRLFLDAGRRHSIADIEWLEQVQASLAHNGPLSTPAP